MVKIEEWQELYMELVAERRKARGWSQEKLAEEAGIGGGKSVISKFSKLKQSVSPNNLSKINRALGISKLEMDRVRGIRPEVYDLTPERWQEYREQRRQHLHPHAIDSEKLQPLVEHPGYESAKEALFSKSHRHVLLTGPIASGKSSTVELLIADWKHENPGTWEVTLLPLSGEFSTGEDWIRSEAYREFLDKVEIRSQQLKRNNLFIIEDIHEYVFENRAMFTFEALRSIDLENSAIIVTTRPDQLEEVRTLISGWRGAKFTEVQVHGNEIATRLIAQNTTSIEQLSEFEHLFHQCGKSLVALAAALATAIKESSNVINIDLAYQAVSAEIDRIFDQRGANSSHDTKDTDKVSLLLVWMLGGMEVEFSAAELAILLDEIDAKTTLPKLVALQEVAQTATDRYRCLRHPAWGQLVMAALQNYDIRYFENIRNRIVRRSISSLKAANAPVEDIEAEIRKDVLTTFFYSLLYHEISTTERLSFMATGRHMHEEFALAGRFFIEGGVSYKGPIENRSELMLEIATSIRRAQNDDHEQRQDLLQQCQIMLDEVVKLEKSRLDTNEITELGGRVLYEVGYLEMLSGDIPAATSYLKQSKIVDLSTKGRELFGAMSAVVESITHVYLNDLQTAQTTLKEIESVFDRLKSDPSVNKTRLNRFFASFIHAKFEIAMAKKLPSEARKLAGEYEALCRDLGISTDINCYLARAAILDTDYSAALEFAHKAIALGASTTTAEGYSSTYRTLGDAYLGMGKLEEARVAYSKVVSEEANLQSFLDHEMATVISRRKMIDDGVVMEKIALTQFV